MYRYQLYTHDPYERCWNATGPVYLDGDLENVKRHVARMLPKEYDSEYGARRDRRPYVDVKCRKGSRKEHGWEWFCTFETEVVIVPSVGELGWTP